MQEVERTLLDNTVLACVHEHAEANPHKCNGLVAVLAGHAGDKRTTNRYSVTGTMGDLFLELGNGVLEAGLESSPTASRALTGL